MEHLSNDPKDHPDQHQNGHELWDEKDHPIMSLDRKSKETEKTTWSEFSNGWKVTVKQMLVLTVRVTARVPNGKVNHLSKVIWDKKIISEFTRFTCSTRKG